MTRIAPGTATFSHAPLEQLPTQAEGAASEVSAATCAAHAPQRSVPAGAAPDQPAPRTSANSRHATIDARGLAADLLQWEGKVNFMYLDTRGFVTTGIGNKLASAEDANALPWQHRSTGLPAEPSEVRAAFVQVNDMRSEYVGKRVNGENPYAAAHYERRTDLVLPEGTAMSLAISRLNKDFLPPLRGLFPGFDSYPAAGDAPG